MDIATNSIPRAMRVRTPWQPHDIKSRLLAGGVGFLFHATDRFNVSFGYEDADATTDDIWATPPLIAGPIFLENQIIGAHLASPVYPELWAGSHAGIRRFRNEGYAPLLRLSEQCGLTHVGLAALIPFATQFGEYAQDERRLVATTGHGATVAAMGMILNEVCRRCDVEISQVSTGVFGAAGSIGSMTAKWMVHLGVRRLVLVDVRDRLKQVAELANGLKLQDARLKIDVVAAEDAVDAPAFDAGLIATNKAAPWLKTDVLKKASVWIDDSHPRAVEPQAEELLREDVMCLECYVRGPHSLCQTVPFRLPTPRDCYSCFAELYICWREAMTADFVIGRPTLDQIAMMLRLLEVYGFRVGPFADKAGNEISDARLDRVFGNFRSSCVTRKDRDL